MSWELVWASSHSLWLASSVLARNTSYVKSLHPHTPATNTDKGNTDERKVVSLTVPTDWLSYWVQKRGTCPELQKLLTTREKKRAGFLVSFLGLPLPNIHWWNDQCYYWCLWSKLALALVLFTNEDVTGVKITWWLQCKTVFWSLLFLE